jgi:zinc/manganese transport system permease protein
VSSFLSPVFQTGFFQSAPVHTAIAIGAAVAVVSGAVGVFTVTRSQSFASEALADIGTTGGSGAFLASVSPIWGFLTAGLLGAAAMELLGIQRPRERDLATGIVLGAGLGLGALLIYLDTTVHNTSNAVVTVLFGSLFAISSSTIPLVVALAALIVVILALILRPLMLATVSPELAGARGVPVRAVGIAHLVALALAVALCALTIGSILSTALLIGPAASALRVVKRPLTALLTAAMLGLSATWIGIVLAYDSFYWPPKGSGWPVSFFVVAIVFVQYLLCGALGERGGRRRVSVTERSWAREGDGS